MINREIQLERMITDILISFDFEGVHNLMKKIKWSWVSTDGVPSIIELKEMAVKLLREAIENGEKNKDYYEVATGGLVAEYFYNEGELRLSFVIDRDSSFLNQRIK